MVSGSDRYEAHQLSMTSKSTVRINDTIIACPGCGALCLAGRSLDDHIAFCSGYHDLHHSRFWRNQYSSGSVPNPYLSQSLGNHRAERLGEKQTPASASDCFSPADANGMTQELSVGQ
jgi:hypothetical protein